VQKLAEKLHPALE
jgi:chromosome segregation ATPase